MDNITHHSVLRQCFSLLSVHDDAFACFDYRVKKLQMSKVLKLSVAAQLARSVSYEDTAEILRSNEDLENLLGLESISGAQLSRSFNRLPTAALQDVFYRLTV